MVDRVRLIRFNKDTDSVSWILIRVLVSSKILNQYLIKNISKSIGPKRLYFRQFASHRRLFICDQTMSIVLERKNIIIYYYYNGFKVRNYFKFKENKNQVAQLIS